MTNTIKCALDSKNISPAYYTTMPAFLRSEGPFSIYDHSLRYDKNLAPQDNTLTDKVTIEAIKRFENDISNLEK